MPSQCHCTRPSRKAHATCKNIRPTESRASSARTARTFKVLFFTPLISENPRRRLMLIYEDFLCDRVFIRRFTSPSSLFFRETVSIFSLLLGRFRRTTVG